MKNSYFPAVFLISILLVLSIKSKADQENDDTAPVSPDIVWVNSDTAQPLIAALAKPASPPPADTVRVGIYITSIHNINFKEREYDITFWLWLKYKNKRFDFSRNLEIPNAKEEKHSYVVIDTGNNQTFLVMKVQCIMKDAWQVDKFPFDKQTLWLTIENSQFDSESLIFVPEDLTNYTCHCDERTRYSLRGWKIDRCIISKNDSSIYKTAFGYGNDINATS